jgi:hypothetical protein
MTGALSAPVALAQGFMTPRPHSVIRPGALTDIPQHIPEIGWDTDVPSLFVIRFQPEKMSFEPDWSSWVTEMMLKRTGFMTRAAVDPWPRIFAGNSSFVNMPGGQLSPQDMQAFQSWCLRRSQVIAPILVHSTPFVAPLARQTAEVLPLGLRRGQPKESQGVMSVGFGETVGLTLTRNADDDAATVPPEVLAALPPAGVSLETRLRWTDPVPVPLDNPMAAMAMPVALRVPGEPVSLRLVADRRVLWEHRYDGAAPSASAGAKPPAKAAPGHTPDIKF